jgi:hypothetical protein
MEKILLVSSEVQRVLMERVYITEFMTGFWKNHKPAGHGDVWKDVVVQVSQTGQLGPVGFVTKNYNVANLDFINPNEDLLVELARSVKPTSTFKSIKKELVELGQIIGGRLMHRDSTAVTIFRGNHRNGKVTVSAAKCRAAGKTLVQAAAEANEIAEKVKAETPCTAKRTVVKRKDPA